MTNSTKVIKDIKKHISSKVSQKAVELIDKLDNQTPILTGFAKANWHAAIGRVPNIIPNITPPKAVSSAMAKQASTVNSLLSKYSIDKGPAYVYNNTPYIVKLNSGFSKQQPVPGYVDRIVFESF